MGKMDVGLIIDVVTNIASSPKGRKFLCGTYSDGKPRSVIDAMRDEYISPKDRERWDRIKEEKKKKKKKAKKAMKKGKKKNKYKSDGFNLLNF